MKKFFIGLLSVIALIVLLIVGETYMANREMQNIVHGEEGKVAIENMLKIMDEKALTPEGKIKSYKIDESYTKRNPMGGIGIKLIINNNDKLTVKTILNKYPSIGYLEHGMIVVSPELSALVPDKGKRLEEKNNGQDR